MIKPKLGFAFSAETRDFLEETLGVQFDDCGRLANMSVKKLFHAVRQMEVSALPAGSARELGGFYQIAKACFTEAAVRPSWPELFGVDDIDSHS